MVVYFAMPDTDLTPRSSNTGLYVTGAALLGLGWVAALRSVDEPAESLTEAHESW